MPRLAPIVFAFLLLLPRPIAAKVYDPETFTLKNGMQVVVVSNPRAPVVAHMVWYKVGAADEPPGTSGIAHYFEHLMFKGTKKVPPGELSKIVARNGGRDNAFTSWDYTAYFQQVAKDRLEMVMELEADRMKNLQLSEAVVAPELLVVLEERSQRTDNDPAARWAEEVRAALYHNHPYGRPIIGWRHEIERLTLADAKAWHQRWYAPNNAILVVSGDVRADDVRRLAEKTYGRIAARPVPERVRVEEPPANAERRVILRDETVQQPQWQRSWLAPGYRTAAEGEAYALEVLAEIVGGGATGRLYRSLVVERKLAAAAGAGYGGDALDQASFAIYASPVPGVAPEALEAALEAEIAALLQEGVSAEEVAAAKSRMVAAAIYARDSLMGPAYAFGMALTTGQSVADVEAWPARIEAVTPEAVNAAARRVLAQFSTTGLLLGAGEAREARAREARTPAAQAPAARAPAAQASEGEIR
jgi:zinc protease